MHGAEVAVHRYGGRRIFAGHGAAGLGVVLKVAVGQLAHLSIVEPAVQHGAAGGQRGGIRRGADARLHVNGARVIDGNAGDEQDDRRHEREHHGDVTALVGGKAPG